MKKTVLIIICVLIIIGVGVGIYFKKKAPVNAINAVLPKEAALYIHMNEVERNLGTLTSLPLWDGIKSINYDLFFEKNVFNAQQKKFIRFIQHDLSEGLTHPVVRKLFGNEVALAAYLPERDLDSIFYEMKVNPGALQELLSGVFIITRIDPEMQFVEFISRFIDQFGSDVIRGETEYKGEIVHTINNPRIGLKFGFVRLDDLLVIGVGEGPARKSIDVFKRDLDSLEQDVQFKKVREGESGSSAVQIYFNFQTVYEVFKQQAEILAAKIPDGMGGNSAKIQLDASLEKFQGLQGADFTLYLKPKVKFDFNLTFDPAQLSSAFAPIYTCPPTRNETVHFIPKNVLGYQWGNCLKLEHHWVQLQKELLRADKPEFNMADFEAKLGFKVREDIIEAFGDEFGGYLSDIEVNGIFPFPKLLLFVEVKDVAKVNHLMSKLTENPLILPQEKTVNGISIKYFALPFGESIRPGFCFLNNYLLIASSEQLLSESIQALNNSSKSITADSAFKEIDIGFSEPSRNIQFVRVGNLIEKSKKVIEWSRQWMSARNKKTEAFKVGSEKPLKELEERLVKDEAKMEALNNRIAKLEDEIWSLESKEEDAGSQKRELQGVKNQVTSLESEIASDYERKARLLEILGQYEGAKDQANRQVYFDEIIYPALEGIKSVETFGMRATVEDDRALSTGVFKME